MIPVAVVFDCDGVLVDSEPHSRRSWVTVLGSLDHPGTTEDVAACTGLGFLPTRDALARLAPLPDPPRLWPLLMEALTSSFSEHGLNRFDDAIAVLDAVEAAGIPFAVASASPRQRLDLTLATAGLADRFGVSVAGDEVSHGKPAPDGYLAALAALGVGVAGSLAIEDSAMGVQSARAAGMRVLAVVRESAARIELEGTGVTMVERVSPALLGL